MTPWLTVVARLRQPASGAESRDLISVMVWSMAAVYLLVDTISGAMLQATGGVAPLSQAWKALILIFLLFWWSIVSTRGTLALLVLSAVILIGPIIRLVATGSTDSTLEEVTGAIKVMLPALTLSFCCAQLRQNKRMFLTWTRRVLWCCVGLMAMNVGIGLLGYGYTAYGVAQSGGIGVTGFFYAGNEVGATYVVLCAFVLVETWSRARRLYLFAALAVVAMGFLIATKSAILGGAALAFAVPIVSSLGGHTRLGWTASALLTASVAGVAIAAFRFWQIIEQTGVANRLLGILAERGWIGVIFSGREQFVARSVRSLWEQASVAEIVFGAGQSGLLRWSGNLSTETDPLDLYFWFGMPGVLYCLALYAVFLFLPWRACADRSNLAAPAILLANALLIVLSIVGGHVVLSGMVGIAWGILTAYALVGNDRSGAAHTV
jgi:hypothetical protein